MRTVKLKCGCQYEKTESESWVTLCPPQEAAYQATAARWRREREAGVSEEPSPVELVPGCRR